MSSVSEYRGLGLNGGEYINDTVAKTGTWFAIQIMEDDTTIAAQSSNVDNLNDIVGENLAANTVLYGAFSGITLTDGAVIAYNV